MRYVFTDCELDTDLFVLHRQGRAIRLRPKVFQVLLFLLEHRDAVVSKDTLIEAVWPGQCISEATLADVIRAVRRAVGDGAHRPHVIRTRHGHGYHFIAEVRAVAASPSVIHVQETPSLASPSTSDRGALDKVSSPNGERKIVTVLYGSLGHSATLSERLGLDSLHNLMQARYNLVRRIVQQYEGTLQPLQGDWGLAVFGVPMTYEDHAWRAALTALAIRDGCEALRQSDDPTLLAALAVRFGLHSGQVAVGAIGQAQELSDLVVGEVVSVAITLYEHAKPGTILCSDTTARLLPEVMRLCMDYQGPAVPIRSWPNPATSGHALGGVS
jgi:class 3 adenylate cyclase